jgi:hypothetical protein
MEDLISRAKGFLRGPCCLVQDKRSPLILELIEEYGESGGLGPESHKQLSQCEQFAEAQARESSSSPDASLFFSNAAKLLREIRVDVQGR